MRFSHVLVLGLIAFLVFRLTQSVQNPQPPEAPSGNPAEAVQTSGEPAGATEGEQEESARRNRANTALKTVIQRLVAPAPTSTPGAAAPAQATYPASASAAAGPTPVPLSPRERLRLSEARRPELLREYGAPRNYHGTLLRHLQSRTIVVRSPYAGELLVEDYAPGEQEPDGIVVSFDAWPTGIETYPDEQGVTRTRRRLIYSAPPLPLWDSYGRPINRDVLPAETIRQAGVHGPTMLDKRPK